MNRTHKRIFLAISLFFALTASISAAPGDLDTTFGNGGIVITSGYTLNQVNTASGMAMQSDGKIVLVGNGTVGYVNWDSFTIARYNSGGSLDTSFGGGGIVTTQVGGGASAGASAVAIQSDGKIVVAGGVSSDRFVVVRYNPDGALDSSFNGTGIVITPGGGAHSVAIQADGKIVVAGGVLTDSTWSFVFVRYNADGSLDSTFNGTGKVIIPGGVANSIAIQSDGKIIAAGSIGNFYAGFAIVRCNPNGTLDTSFNGTGKVNTSVGDFGGGASALALQTDGKIVAAGTSFGNNAPPNTAVVRYNRDGSLDTSFGGTGKILTITGTDSASSVAIQLNGKIVVAGYRYYSVGGPGFDGSNFAVFRYNTDGSLDTSFNGTGEVITPVGYGWTFAASVAIQADGKIVAAGGTGPDEFPDFAMVRYQGDAPNLSCSTPNPIDCPDFFIREQYLDFLGRETEPEGLQFYLNILNGCNPFDTECIKYTRGALSGNFFRSPEFGRKGAYVSNLFNIVFGQRPKNVAELNDPTKVERPHYGEFMADLAMLSTPNDDPILTDQKKDQLANTWLGRSEVQSVLPSSLSSQQFVQKLESIAGVTLANESALIANLNNGIQTRAQVLRAIAESNEVVTKFYIPNFVTMEYLGYLRRDPEDCHLSSDPANCGYIFHNNRFNTPAANPDLIENIIVRGFIESPEYRRRFGP